MLCLLPPTISLEHRVATVEAVVAEIARKTGQPLAIRGEMRDEVLYVDLKPRSAGDLMRLVARAASAEWTSEAGKFYLGRSASLRRTQARTERDDTARDLQEGLAPLLATADAKPWTEGTDHAAAIRRVADAAVPPNDQEAWARQLARMAFAPPAGRLLARILRATPLASFATIPMGETARFASRPRERQEPLVEADLGRYAEEHALLADEWARMGPEDRGALERAMGYSAVRPLPGGETPYALLFATRYPQDAFTFALRLYDPRGRRVDESSVTVEARPRPAPDAAAWRKAPVRLGPAAASFKEGMGGRKVDPAQAALARDPVAHEPLGLILGDALDEIAAARGEETILAIPDETGMGVLSHPHATLGEVDDALGADVAFETIDGVRVGRARRPASAAATKTDRTVLRGLMAAMRGGRYPGLDGFADYALRQNPHAGATWLEKVALQGAGFSLQVFSGTLALDVDAGERDLARVYGSLSPEGRAAFRQGSPLPFAALAPGAREDLERELFRRAPPAEHENRLEDASALFDGLPAGGELVATGLDTNPLVAVAPAGEGTEFAGVLGLAFLEYAKEKGELKANDPDVAAGRYVPVWANALKFEIRLSPAFRSPESLTDLVYDPTTTPVVLDALPPAHQQERQRVLKLLRERDRPATPTTP